MLFLARWAIPAISVAIFGLISWGFVDAGPEGLLHRIYAAAFQGGIRISGPKANRSVEIKEGLAPERVDEPLGREMIVGERRYSGIAIGNGRAQDHSERPVQESADFLDSRNWFLNRPEARRAFVDALTRNSSPDAWRAFLIRLRGIGDEPALQSSLLLAATMNPPKIAKAEIFELARAMSLDEQQFRRLQAGLVSEMALVDADAVKSYIETESEPSRKGDLTFAAAEGMLRNSQAGTITWALENLPVALRDRRLETLFAQWYDIDPAGLRQWINAHLVPRDRDISLKVYSLKIMHENVLYALSWAGFISDPGMRDELIALLYGGVN